MFRLKPESGLRKPPASFEDELSLESEHIFSSILGCAPLQMACESGSDIEELLSATHIPGTAFKDLQKRINRQRWNGGEESRLRHHLLRKGWR